jgi:hypothetical protein
MNLKLQTPLLCYGIFSMMIPLQSACAQGVPASGLYEIVSGRYEECCGFGGPFVYSLPNPRQSFLQFTLDAQTKVASMAFLGDDRQTVFTIFPCPPGTPVPFSFDHGLVFSDRVVFHVDPGPLPNRAAWNYTVAASETGLHVDGALDVRAGFCADVPTDFNHSNVVAVPVLVGPLLEGFKRDGDQVQFKFTGEPANDFFVEFSDRLPAQSWLSLTNFRAKLQPIQAVVTDSLTNGPTRFYRVRQQDCQCD